MPKRVLIADDNDSMRAVIRSFVEKQPDVEVCALTSNGVDTIATATELEPDLLILDVLMPGLNGIEVASVIKNRLPKAKTILFTLYDDAIRTIAPMMGANAVLTKVDGISGLLLTIRRLLSDRRKEIEKALALAVRGNLIDPSHLESLTLRIDAPLTRCSLDLKYLWASQKYADWLEKPRDKVAGRSILDVLGREAFYALHHRFDQALSGEAISYEALATYDKIGLRRIFATYLPTVRPDGQVDGWLACVEDVTDRGIEELDRPVTTLPIPEVGLDPKMAQ